MTLTDTTPSAAEAPVGPEAPSARRRGRLWALAGVLAAGCGAATMVLQGSDLAAGYDHAISGDPVAIAARMADAQGVATLFHLLATASAVLLVVLGAGLARRLRDRSRPDSLVPTVAVAGAVLTAGVMLLGSGLDTEFGIFAPDPGYVPAEHISFYSHWIGTIPWLWTGLGLTALATAVAAVRRVVPRWHVVPSGLLGALTLAAGLSPMQYAALLPAVAWLLVTSLGLLLGDRR